MAVARQRIRLPHRAWSRAHCYGAAVAGRETGSFGRSELSESQIDPVADRVTRAVERGGSVEETAALAR